jgi:uncharacterized protein
MTPEERQLIGDLFERMRSTGLSEKDREAEAFINQAARATPDAAYKLVQSVLVQEHALEEASQRMEDLEARIRDLEDALSQQQQPQARQAAPSGGFLGGLFGSRPQQPAPQPSSMRQSVPSFGQGRGGYQQQPGGNQPAGSPWSAQQRPGQGGFGQPQPQQAAGGGFMKSALTTAAGVAGGMLAAGMIKDMMGGSSAQASEKGDAAASNEPSGYEVASNDAQYQDPDDNDPGNTDMGWDSGDSGDMDI